MLLHSRVTTVHNDTKENERQIKILQDAHEKASKNISTLFRQTAELRKEIEELSEKVSELYVLKKQLAVSILSYLFILRHLFSPKSNIF